MRRVVQILIYPFIIFQTQCCQCVSVNYRECRLVFYEFYFSNPVSILVIKQRFKDP